ncbi:MAG: transcription-repair coupling factor [Prevotella ruminicola]|uniref:Transcription-repair-coupling factor n=1 Tax=Xylanibacter ruminicola TaxID=839 RepID=A0A928GJ66_XYLRU|nr:transcription-repair coupling factor [Xylanibacter ruminicola]
MKLEDLEKVYAKLPQVAALANEIGNTATRRIFLEGLLASSAPMLFGSLAAKCKAPILFVLQDAEDAGYFYHDLTQLLGTRQVLFFPSSYRRAIKYGQLDSASQILRTEVLTQISQLSSLTSHLYIITYPEALAEMVVPKQTLNARTLVIEKDQQVPVGDVTKQLRELGFREVDYVYEPGQFALRGSILDVYSYSCEYPYRIDFFGDDVDSVRTFQVEDQLSLDVRDRVEIVPELEATDAAQEPFLSLLPQDTIIATKDYLYVRDAIDACFQKEMPLITGPQFMSLAEKFRRIEFGHRSSVPDCSVIRFNITIQPLFHKNFELLFQAFDTYLQQGYQLYILADSAKQNERLKDIFAQRAEAEGEQSIIRFTPVDKTLHEGFIDDDLKVCFFTDHQIFDRFHKYNLKSDKARSGKMALTLKEIQQFEIGDFVVHVDHGVGKFGGLVRMPQGDGYQEMIKIIYQKGDAIYVSIHSLYKVSKYKGHDNGEAPRLSTLGTGQWERIKERTKAHIKEIARDLIKLYAKRRREKGFAFSHDSYLQHELEASFLYEDTPDQLKATQDVKADMEKARPMDRLVCGDVGFGKTEVAVRAAFKAAVDGKQVAVLVPTTVLAYQHFRTFSGRLKDMPVRVDYLTRARTQKDTTQILKDLAEGKIDIIIGTHRLISKSLKFKDLGLLIIDEEQKFGVSTKEKLRQMKTSVDTLTMSATPIPRTLQFSLVGARDLSVIQTPPPNRYPIQTEIHTFSPEILSEAINFEMSRNGQVYFVNNRISDLEHLAEIIQKYVPDARIAIGHGQMKPEQLEKIILDFSNYDYDVLLSTTIVENGIDIPNANTIIINGAHNFGLSDLHQMRGRVGRGNRKAFCYLLAPPLSALNPESRRRLEALENFSDLGSGINIAMQDLDIRGAGNLLGSEQSGFIADLGYETYQKILNQAMSELKNEEPEFAAAASAAADSASSKASITSQASDTSNISWVDDCALDSDIEMYFPDQYVPSDSERMLLYRELDNLANSTQLQLQLDAYRKRLLDRFGPIPAVSEELILVVPLRVAGKQLGIEKIMLKQQKMYFYFVSRDDSPYFRSEAFGKILHYVSNNPRQCNFREGSGKHSVVISDIPTVAAALTVCQQILTL